MGEYERVKGKSVALHHRELGRRWLHAAEEAAHHLGVAIELFPPGHLSDESPASEEHPPTSRAWDRTKDCFFPWDRAVITASGDLLPCCAAPEPLGNLRTDSFLEIWYGPAYGELRRALLSGDLLPMCRTCTGQGWRERSPWDGVRAGLRLERIRARQRLRRSATLRKIKNAVLR
jgi:MoaA/NifB/PqqE/SkfB family radical SAM enzyme